MPLRLAELWVYPVKSCRGVRLPAAMATARGLEGDRRWMLVDPAGRFVSQRTEPALALVGVALEGKGEGEGQGLRLEAPGRAPLVLPGRPTGSAREVEVWGSSTVGVGHAEGSAWFSAYLGREVALVHQPDEARRATSRGGGEVGFADGYPYLLLGRASVEDLDARIAAGGGRPVGMGRFRPNLVVEGAAPYAEDRWAALRVGSLRFRGVKRCERCVLTTVDPATAEKGKEPLRTLARYRRAGGKVWLGTGKA